MMNREGTLDNIVREVQKREAWRERHRRGSDEGPVNDLIELVAALGHGYMGMSYSETGMGGTWSLWVGRRGKGKAVDIPEARLGETIEEVLQLAICRLTGCPGCAEGEEFHRGGNHADRRRDT